MARRPRPAHRAPPKTTPTVTTKPSSSKPQKRAPPAVPSDEDDSDADEDSGPDAFFVQGSSRDAAAEDSDDGSEAPDDDSDDDDKDADAPRVVQWVDDDEDAADEEDEPAALAPNDLSTLQDDLATLPFGSLRKAQRTLAHASMETDSSDSGTDSDAADPSSAPPKKAAPAQEWSTRPRPDIAKRAHKHAPTEVTAKRPVGRARQVVPLPKDTARDPRFAPVGGAPADAVHFSKQYAFLADLRAGEHAELRASLAQARKALKTAPAAAREEREEEVRRLEAALHRAQSAVARDTRERVERDALARAKAAEREKRKGGKGVWHMRDAEKKELLVKARYEALAAAGGRGAVRKAIEKKQRKVGQKEKRARPYVARADGAGGASGADARKRPRSQPGGPPQKRPRFG